MHDVIELMWRVAIAIDKIDPKIKMVEVMSVANHICTTGTLPEGYTMTTSEFPNIHKLDTHKHQQLFKDMLIDVFRWKSFGDIPKIVAREESEPSPYTVCYNSYMKYDGCVPEKRLNFNSYATEHTQRPVSEHRDYPESLKQIFDKHSCIYPSELTTAGLNIVLIGGKDELIHAIADIKANVILRSVLLYIILVYPTTMTKDEALDLIKDVPVHIPSKRKALTGTEWKQYDWCE